jgi:hypothetical protein
MDPYIYPICLGGDALELFSFFRLIDNHLFVCLIVPNVHRYQLWMHIKYSLCSFSFDGKWEWDFKYRSIMMSCITNI